MTFITLTPNSECPVCRRPVDAAAHDKDYTPKEDNISICMSCTAVLIFNKDLTIRAMTEEEWDCLPSDYQEYITFERLRCKILTGKCDPEMN